jgi:hypothetical protein
MPIRIILLFALVVEKKNIEIVASSWRLNRRAEATGS